MAGFPKQGRSRSRNPVQPYKVHYKISTMVVFCPVVLGLCPVVFCPELRRYRPQTISATNISATDEIVHRPHRPQPIPYRPQAKSISATDYFNAAFNRLASVYTRVPRPTQPSILPRSLNRGPAGKAKGGVRSPLPGSRVKSV